MWTVRPLFTTTATAGGCSLESPGWRRWGRRIPSTGRERPRYHIAMRRCSEKPGDSEESLQSERSGFMAVSSGETGAKEGFCCMAMMGGPSSPLTRRPSPGWLSTFKPRSPRGNGMLFQDESEQAYLEKTCIEWLEKYLSYGNETLLRTGVTVRGKTEVEDGMEMHVCRLDGFYPREIDAFWTRDGRSGGGDLPWVFGPNADGTYHYWLSIRMTPKRGPLSEPLDLALEGERLQGGTGWALWQAGRWWERNLAPDVSRWCSCRDQTIELTSGDGNYRIPSQELADPDEMPSDPLLGLP
ncbi:hypothetical protein E2320_022397, partial [Naja naja]